MSNLEDLIRDYATFDDRSTDPATPDAGTGLVYVKGGQLHTIDDAGTVAEYGTGGGGGSPDLLHVRDEKSSATNGGGASSGWNTRVLNTSKTNEIAGASLTSNRITLPAGTYYAEWVTTAFRTDQSTSRLRDVDTPATLVVGVPQHTRASIGDGSVACLGAGRFTLSSETDVELQLYATTAKSGDGLGLSAGSGEVEVYSDLRIWAVS